MTSTRNRNRVDQVIAPWFWKFWKKKKTLEFEKMYCHFWNWYSWIFHNVKFHAKTKIIKFRTNIALFDYFWAGIWKSHCCIWKKRSQIFLKPKFWAKSKSFNLGLKIPYFGIFGLEFEDTIVIFEHPQICLIPKFFAKVKILNFGPKMPYLDNFELVFWKNIVIFEINTLEYFLKQSFVQKQKS